MRKRKSPRAQRGRGESGKISRRAPSGVGRDVHTLAINIELRRCERGREAELSERGTSGADEHGLRLFAAYNKACDRGLFGRTGPHARGKIYQTLLASGRRFFLGSGKNNRLSLKIRERRGKMPSRWRDGSDETLAQSGSDAELAN